MVEEKEDKKSHSASTSAEATADKKASRDASAEKIEGEKNSEKPVRGAKQAETMESLIAELGDNLLPFAEGDTIEANILAVGGNRIWVDVAGQSLGFIPEKELTSKAGLKNGDKIFATVISMEDDEGNVVLSMKRADREKYWTEMEAHSKSGEPFAIKISDANKGGLITDVGGIMGFLPVSQLAPAHYPRVTGGDKDEILNRLRNLIGQELMVKVINCEKETGKLIFSEKAVKAQEVRTKIDKFKIGDEIKGRITGIVDFGLFVSIDPEIEALVHISEVSWTRVSDLHRLFKVGDEVETVIISIEDGRISLSIKKLLPDPWVKAASKYKIGDMVEGEVTKITPFGAFVALDEKIDGLVHISEISNERVVDPGQFIELGKKYQFKIISIEAENHRLGLSMKIGKTKEEPHSAKSGVYPVLETGRGADAKETPAENIEEPEAPVKKVKSVKPKKVKKTKKAEEAVAE